MDRHADPYGFLKGEGTPEDQAHVAGCSECRRNIEETRALSSLLQGLPEIEPAPEVWTRIESRLEQPSATFRRVRLGWRLAAAASLAVAILSITMWATKPADTMAATVSSASPGSGIEPGTRINLGETFHSPSFATLTLPGAGTLKLNRDTKIRFDSRRRVTLLAGEVYAEINPGGAGFEIVSGPSTVTVRGTKFGVRHTETAYVVEGKVGVAGPAGHVELSGNEASTLGPERLRVDSVDAYVRWTRVMDRPTLVLQVRPRGPAVILPGKPLEIDLVFTSDAPLLIDDPRNPSRYLLVLFAGRSYSQSLNPAQPVASRVEVSNGKVLLDVHKEAVLTYLLKPELFQDKGLHTLSVAYLDREAGQEAYSETFLVEVRP